MLDYIRAACMRHDTVVALAFRKALGMGDAPVPSARVRTHAGHGTYDGMAECMAQRFGVRL